MTRIQQAFARARAERRPAVIAYVMAGDPDAKTSFEIARAVLEECDILELGVPFSDPVADGPVIERAAVRALANGMKLAHALDLARDLRATSEKPIVMMTYYNPVYRRGVARFAEEARRAGVDGVILPDVPLEESAGPGAAFRARDIDLIQLASPATGPERLQRLVHATRGFLYVVSSFGVTGARTDLAPETVAMVKRAKDACAGVTPFAVGFGVSKPEHVRMLHEAGAEGVIVGSAIVARVEHGESASAVARYVGSLRLSS